MKLLKTTDRLAGSTALRNASIDDLRVLLCLVEDSSLTGEALAEAAGCSLSRASGAVSYWKECGVIAPDGGLPHPLVAGARDGRDVASIVERYALGDLLDGCQALLGHTLNATETTAIVGLVDDLSLDSGYILTLLAYCAEEGKGSVRYMEKTATSLVERGISTLSALDAYITGERERTTAEGVVRRLFGVGSRPFSRAEKEKIARWSLYGYGEDVIGLAYDVTVNATGKASLPYADKILSSWHEKGCMTAEDCAAALYEERSRPRPTPRQSTRERGRTSASNRSFETGDFMKRALERSYAAIGAESGEETK